ncbi:MAG TPA: cytochrome d ubiquinol oxidase subunit II [Thiothrix sp.]|nr:cytochrome d ubiquinol oxidase subunit II [Thiothrix sp.]
MEFLDYSSLKLTWWILVGVLWIGFAITEGFDMGVSMLIPFVGKTDDERRVAINAIAPHWDGNQVWLVLAAGALFAVWPTLYATTFSGLYPAMMILLFSLIIRPAAMDYRSKLDHAQWRSTWDWLFILPGVVPPLILGVAMGNLFLGLPFSYDEYMRSTYTGSFFGLFHPFALLSGALAVAMFLQQGVTFLALRTHGTVHSRAQSILPYASLAVVALFALAGIWLWLGIDGMAIKGNFDVSGPSNPTKKTVEMIAGGWLHNYTLYPIMLLAPIMGFVGAFGAWFNGRATRTGLAFFFSSMSLVGIILTAGFSLFPFILPSSTNISHSLTMWDATASHLTLTISFFAAAIFVPIIIGYTLYCYISLWRTYNVKFIRENDHSIY